MKRLFSAVCLCGVLLAAALFFFSPGSKAENNIVSDLLDLPAPPPPNPLMEATSRTRPEDFYKRSNQPKDDAPLQDILDYWERQNSNYRKLGFNLKPTKEVRDRILKECEDKPEKLTDYLNLFEHDEEVAGKIKSLYDTELNDKKLGEEWERQVKQWLTYNSKFFTEKLVKSARAVKDQSEYVTNQDELLALTKVDWDTAQPIVDALMNRVSSPVSNTLAKWAYYVHAIENDDKADVEKYRDMLKAIVEDKNNGPGMRDLAMDGLTHEKEWEGRDEWYISLLGDETLHELKVNGQTYTGLTTIILYSPPERFAKKMIELAGSDNQAVRNAAVRNLSELIDEGDPEVVKALLPWLEDPKWAKEVSGERRKLVAALKEIKMPESVPGLIVALNEKVVVERGNANANVARYSSNSVMSAPAVNAYNAYVGNMAYRNNEDIYPMRDSAIYALSAQKDPRAVPALRGVLPHVDGYMRTQAVKALLDCNGFAVSEQLAAIETTLKKAREAMETAKAAGVYNNAANTVMNVARNTGAFRIGEPGTDIMEAVPMVSAAGSTGPYDPSMLPFMLGQMLLSETDISDELVRGVVTRMEQLQRSDPPMAAALKNVLEHWRGPAINLIALKQLKTGTISLELVVRLLSQRKELKQTMLNDIFDANTGTPFAHGISACLLEDDNNYFTILDNGDLETRTAMLGCARMVRANLPLAKVAENLKSPNKQLATAAERYLESEDSPAARQIILSFFPNDMRILGARVSFEPEGSSSSYDFQDMAALFQSVGAMSDQGGVASNDAGLISEEKRLKKEMADNKELLGIFTYDKNYIRVYADRAVFSWEEDVSRYWERTLKKEEFEQFHGYIIDQNVDVSPPYLSACDYCEGKEFMMMGRGGGRRIFFRGSQSSKLEKDLDTMFSEMHKPQAKLHYWMEKYLPGLDILYADENMQALALWKNNADFRLLIADKPRREKAQEQLNDYYENGTGEDEGEDTEEGSPAAAAANMAQKIRENYQERREKMEREGIDWYTYSNGKLGGITSQPPGMEYFPPKDNLEPRATEGAWRAKTPTVEVRADYEGLYKITGGRVAKIKEGNYSRPIVTPNGRWAIVTKMIEYQAEVVRVNLATNQEFKVNLPKHFRNEAVAYIPSLNKVLLMASNYDYYDRGYAEDEGGGEGGGDGGGEEEGNQPALPDKGDHFLLDADTGNFAPINSEVRPLKQQTVRALQPASVPDTFWAAIPEADKKRTSFGIYNAKTLMFKNMLTIPEISFDSMDMWVDEKDGKIYFVYSGHLLSLPLPPKPAGP